MESAENCNLTNSWVIEAKCIVNEGVAFKNPLKCMMGTQPKANRWPNSDRTLRKYSNLTNLALHTSMVAPPSIAMLSSNHVAQRKPILSFSCHPYHPTLFWTECQPCFYPAPCSPWEPISTKGQVAWEGLASNFSLPANAPPIVKPCINSH
jgi:hypothetical protein